MAGVTQAVADRRVALERRRPPAATKANAALKVTRAELDAADRQVQAERDFARAEASKAGVIAATATGSAVDAERRLAEQTALNARQQLTIETLESDVEAGKDAVDRVLASSVEEKNALRDALDGERRLSAARKALMIDARASVAALESQLAARNPLEAEIETLQHKLKARDLTIEAQRGRILDLASDEAFFRDRASQAERSLASLALCLAESETLRRAVLSNNIRDYARAAAARFGQFPDGDA